VDTYPAGLYDAAHAGSASRLRRLLPRLHRQAGRSGLGLEAQQAAIRNYLRNGDRLLQPPYVEVESGRSAARPKLTEARGLGQLLQSLPQRIHTNGGAPSSAAGGFGLVAQW
jgi:hypothetical protein